MLEEQRGEIDALKLELGMVQANQKEAEEPVAEVQEAASQAQAAALEAQLATLDAADGRRRERRSSVGSDWFGVRRHRPRMVGPNLSRRLWRAPLPGRAGRPGGFPPLRSFPWA